MLTKYQSVATLENRIRATLTRKPMLRRVLLLALWTATGQLCRRIRIRLDLQDQHDGPASTDEQDTQSDLIQARAQRDHFQDCAKLALADFLESRDELVHPVNQKQPDVSLVIVLWNSVHFTLMCLQHLLRSQSTTIQVILVDNASTDQTAQLLERLTGFQIIRNATNEGFLAACNQGASLATGRSLLLLNSDAFVHPNAIATAFATLQSAPEIGAVGARLVLPTGKLQEAGSILWADGATHGYGRGLDPEAGSAMFQRDVDYCSGAFLMTHTMLWQQLGGFDELFRPGYYEESDYCMRLHNLGYRVIYEPQALVDHFEFGSETEPGKADMISKENRKKFRARHFRELRLNHLPHSEANILFARERRRRTSPCRVLIVTEMIVDADEHQTTGACRSAAAKTSVNGRNTIFVLAPRHATWETLRTLIPWDVEIQFVEEGRDPDHAFLEFLLERDGYYDSIIPISTKSAAAIALAEKHAPHITASVAVKGPVL